MRHRSSSRTVTRTPSSSSKTHAASSNNCATSSNPVVYTELPGAQHGFDLFRSRRFDTVIDAIEAFATDVRSQRRAAGLAPGSGACLRP
jgi:acetyl esterase/lipase